MSSVSLASIVCIVLLVLLVPGMLEFLQGSAGRRVRAKTTNVVTARDTLRIRRDSENTCTMYSNEYFNKLAVLECNEMYIEAVLKEIEDTPCGNPLGAELIAACGTNHEGTQCATLGYYTAFDHVFNSCFNYSDGKYRLPSTNNCKNECKFALILLSDWYGCCIHTSDESMIVLTPSLWMNCGIRRPEPCADTPKVAFESRSTRPCSYDYYMREYLYTYCKYLGEGLVKLNMECGHSEQKTLEICGYDKGQYCNILKYPRQTLLAIYDKCHSFFEESTTEWTCTDECKKAIQDFKDLYGCCVISLNGSDEYDDTETQVLRSDLWASCAIEIPQDCTAKSLAQLSPPDDSLKCTNHGSATVPVMICSTLLVMIGLVITA